MTEIEDRTDHPPVLPGAEPMSHAGDRRGALVVHGFTGSPMSMRPVAEAFAAAGWTVEMPRLPGHGTTVEDMASYGWADWTAAADAAYTDLAARTDAVVVVGLSMGGALAAWLGAQHPDVAGLVLVNAAVEPDDFAPLLDQLRPVLASGERFAQGVGNDVADPDVVELAYSSMPIASLISFGEGMVPLKAALPSITAPALVVHSLQDHVVPPGSHAALTSLLGGPVEVVELERSYHVATIDHDRDLIVDRALAFATAAVAAKP
ncbi:carboxylesterase [Kineosporia sp. A_224]|uniref:alpha/beta hydrolase n=1 Tax=Kineosporia sp. A_224 TaxID=1962180 RepID=UPI000B4B26B3|nr:alpha/beta fold hydrolase [Kineosporia sp. A_224]